MSRHRDCLSQHKKCRKKKLCRDIRKLCRDINQNKRKNYVATFILFVATDLTSGCFVGTQATTLHDIAYDKRRRFYVATLEIYVAIEIFMSGHRITMSQP